MIMKNDDAPTCQSVLRMETDEQLNRKRQLHEKYKNCDTIYCSARRREFPPVMVAVLPFGHAYWSDRLYVHCFRFIFVLSVYSFRYCVRLCNRQLSI